MARWLVSIIGEHFDTEELPRWFPDGDAFAIEEDRRVYITGPALENLGGPNDVRKAAVAILNDFAGVIALLLPNFRKPAIGTEIIREEDDGRRSVHCILVPEPAHLRMKAHANLMVWPEGAKHTEAQHLLRAVEGSLRLKVVLALWTEPDASWAQLYRAMEEIEAELGEPLDNTGLCSQRERERFRRTANSAETAGRDARHASGKFEPPKNPMTLAEGRGFIGRVLVELLRGRE
jgi:hypothetical protein